jgi:hypothetical protein
LLIDLIARAPGKSDRQIGKEVGVDHKTIATARAKGEDVGRIPHVATRTDSKGRQQPATKHKPDGVHPFIMTSRQETEDDLDYFPTPPWATRALTRLEREREP